MIPILSTLSRDHQKQLPDAVVAVDALADAIRERIAPSDLEGAAASWRSAQEEATTASIRLPDGRLLWIRDTD